MLTLFNLTPKWVLVAIVAMLSATSCKLKWDNGQLSIEIEKGKTHVALLERNISETTASAAKQAASLEKSAREAEKTAAVRQAALRRDAESARTELDGLRVALSAYTKPRLTASSASIAPGLDYTDPVPELFLQCAGRYVDLAAKADGHASDVKTLMDAWPK